MQIQVPVVQNINIEKSIAVISTIIPPIKKPGLQQTWGKLVTRKSCRVVCACVRSRGIWVALCLEVLGSFRDV